MDSCINEFYYLMQQKYPYEPLSYSEQVESARLATAQGVEVPPEYRKTLHQIEDSSQVLAYFQAEHAFALGLDLGLSMARELHFLQTQ